MKLNTIISILKDDVSSNGFCSECSLNDNESCNNSFIIAEKEAIKILEDVKKFLTCRENCYECNILEKYKY